MLSATLESSQCFPPAHERECRLADNRSREETRASLYGTMPLTRLSLGLLALVLVVGACGGATVSPDESQPVPETPTTQNVPAGSQGEPAPQITLEYFDGSTGSLADLRGRPIVLNFWASWCPACIAEMPDFEAVHQRFGDDVIFIGVDMQDVDRATAERFIADTGVTYAIADDPTGAIFAAFSGFAMPTTVFIDDQGNIVGRQNGAIFEDQLTEMIADLFRLST